METEIQSEDMQTFSRQHASGEVFEAQNIEMARGMCPVLGKMSVEEAGLLLELEAMGKERMAEKPDQPESAINKPVVQRVEAGVRPDKILATKDAHNEVVEVALSSNVQTTQAFEAERQINAVLRSSDNQNEDTIHARLAADTQYGLLAQQETNKSEIMERDESHKKPLMSAVLRETLRLSIVNETEAIDAMAKGEDDRRHAEEMTKTAMVLPQTKLATTQTPGLESVQTIVENKTAFINKDEDVGVQEIDEVVHEALPLNFHERLYDNLELSTEAEFKLLDASEFAEATEVSAGPGDYKLLEEYDAASLMAELEQYEAVYIETVETELAEVIGVNHAEDDTPLFAPAELQPVVSASELSAPIGEIESAITQLAEALDLTQSEESTETYSILEEIIALPVSLEAAISESTEVVEEKLEDLFIELFQAANIDYTPELIMSFIKLTQAHYLEELLETVKEEDFKGLPNEIGTREFLQKLKYGLSNLKQVVINFYEIGKSVLRLYGLSKSMSLASA